jgi:hypothetical protein
MQVFFKLWSVMTMNVEIKLEIVFELQMNSHIKWKLTPVVIPVGCEEVMDLYLQSEKEGEGYLYGWIKLN